MVMASPRERRQQNHEGREREKTRPVKFFFKGRHLHPDNFQLWIDWQIRSHSSQLSIKLSKQKDSKASMTARGSEHRTAGANHIKALTSPSLPEGHNSPACQNPCEFSLYSKLHVPATQCDTIRRWLCVNQMMTAWPSGCLACCHSLVANPLPQESDNWFPGTPVGMLLPSSCTETRLCLTWDISTSIYIQVVIFLQTLTHNTLGVKMLEFHLLFPSGIWEKYVTYIYI